jgi:Peptidase family M23
MRYLAITFALLSVSYPAIAAEITLVPGDTVFLNPTNAGKGFNDLVLHTVLVSTGPDETYRVDGLRIDLAAAGIVSLSKSVSVDRLVGETGEMGEMLQYGMGVLMDAQMLSESGLDGLFDRDMSLASTATLGPNEVLILTRQHFSVDFTPDQLQVTVLGVDQCGTPQEVSRLVPVATNAPRLNYSMPVSGAWLMTSLPSIQSHHRLAPPSEYAVDFFKVDATGSIYQGDVLDARSFFGYGAEVLAAADGEVVFVIADEVQDRELFFPQAGETEEAAGARVQQHNMQGYAADFPRAAAGNLVTIRHTTTEGVEYSSYGHLKTGSVRVKVGDTIKRGQVIAEVADTGDSAAVHLHFQVNAGQNAFMSKSLPIAFTDLQETLDGVDPGRFVKKYGSD